MVLKVREAATKCSAKRSYIDLTQYATGTENWQTMGYNSFRQCMELEILKSKLTTRDFNAVYQYGYDEGYNEARMDYEQDVYY